MRYLRYRAVILAPSRAGHVNAPSADLGEMRTGPVTTALSVAAGRVGSIVRDITQTASGHEVEGATAPHLWRLAVERGFDYVYERGGMRDMPRDLYAVAMHLGNRDVSGRPTAGHLTKVGHGYHVVYSPISVVSIVQAAAPQVRLILRLLVALGYLRVVSEPRPGRGGEGVYELTWPVGLPNDESRGPDIAAAFAILDKAARTPSRRGRDMAVQNARKADKRAVDNFKINIDEAARNGRLDDCLNGRAGDHSKGRAGDHFDDPSPSISFRYQEKQGTTGVPEVTTEGVDNRPDQGKDRQDREGEIGEEPSVQELAVATIRAALEELHDVRAAYVSALRDRRDRRERLR